MTYEEMMALTECQLEAQVRPTSVVKQPAAVPTLGQSVDEMPPTPFRVFTWKAYCLQVVGKQTEKGKLGLGE